MTKNDRWIGLIIFSLGALMLFQMYRINFPEFANDPGPQLMPNIIGVLLVICGLGLLLWPRVDKHEEKDEEISNQKNRKGTMKLIYIALSLIIYILLMKVVGYIISTLLFLLFITWFLSEIKNKRAVVTSVVTSIIVTASVYIIFSEVLSISLPRSIF